MKEKKNSIKKFYKRIFDYHHYSTGKKLEKEKRKSDHHITNKKKSIILFIINTGRKWEKFLFLEIQNCYVMFFSLSKINDHGLNFMKIYFHMICVGLTNWLSIYVIQKKIIAIHTFKRCWRIFSLNIFKKKDCDENFFVACCCYKDNKHTIQTFKSSKP